MTFQTPPLVVPQAPSGAVGDAPPLTAARMAAKAWSHLQAAVAAGRLIEARGWMRLYKDLKPFARDEEMVARAARMEREAADRRAAQAAVEAERLVIPEAPSGAVGDVAPPLHCFSLPESHTPPPADAEPIDAAEDDGAANALPVKELARLITELQAAAALVDASIHDETVRLPLHCFSRPESHHPGQGP
ncbi:hypothetical protein [Brevundimonas sp.]|uniref:hypothetical protein n=1 Tax=Brevundimonas sp. TaxID=1871086 RepID=UPI001D3E7875|nr:hypothetical protein [Brevundimonas sp.]MBA4000790.1 hypothetical protein [Brevundimonas sp.]